VKHTQFDDRPAESAGLSDRSFCQQAPEGLLKVFVLGVVLMIYSVFICFMFRAVPFVFWAGISLGLADLLIMSYNVARVLTLRRPMLTLTRSYLKYGNLNIPWQCVDDVTTFNVRKVTGKRSLLGVVLGDNFRLGRRAESLARRVGRTLSRRRVIAVPKARGLSADELALTILDYRARALGTGGEPVTA
jgi:hypothetical protein